VVPQRTWPGRVDPGLRHQRRTGSLDADHQACHPGAVPTSSSRTRRCTSRWRGKTSGNPSAEPVGVTLLTSSHRVDQLGVSWQSVAQHRSAGRRPRSGAPSTSVEVGMSRSFHAHTTRTTPEAAGGHSHTSRVHQRPSRRARRRLPAPGVPVPGGAAL